MITVKFYEKGEGIAMTLKGHAQTAPYGKDLVCAAATMLAYTVAQAIQFMDEQGKLKKKPKISIREGNVAIVATPKDEDYQEAFHAFWVAQCGAYVLAQNYPQNVKLELFKV